VTVGYLVESWVVLKGTEKVAWKALTMAVKLVEKLVALMVVWKVLTMADEKDDVTVGYLVESWVVLKGTEKVAWKALTMAVKLVEKLVALMVVRRESTKADKKGSV